MKKQKELLLLLFISVIISTVFFSCEKRDYEREIAVTTDSIKDVKVTTAVCWSTMIDAGESGIMEYGHCWALTENPTVSDSIVTTNSPTYIEGTNYSSVLENLEPGLTYYVRSYAKNGVEINYGDDLSFTTIGETPPSIETKQSQQITITTTEIVINITDTGAGTDEITDCGIYWSTDANPTIDDNVISMGKKNTTGEFTCGLTYLQPATTYYVKAYANNEFGITYGEELSFTTDIKDINSLLNLKKVIGGSFNMGTTTYVNAQPVHEINITDFIIGKFEITNQQFADFLNIYGSDTIKNGQFAGELMIIGDDAGLKHITDGWHPQSLRENRPIVGVSWFGAYEFCRFYDGRLPTEAEWEYAARGGNLSDNYLYSGSDTPGNVAWYGKDVRYGSATDVGSKDANELGLFDMSGNVSEWCSDWYDKLYYETSTSSDPQGADSGTYKCTRGGSWDNSSSSLINPIVHQITSVYRLGQIPTTKSSITGFRFVSDI